MSPERARATWTDERLDDLSRRVDVGFARLDGDMRSLGTRIDGVGERIDALQRTMLQVGGGMIATILVAAAGIVAAQL